MWSLVLVPGPFLTIVSIRRDLYVCKYNFLGKAQISPLEKNRPNQIFNNAAFVCICWIKINY